METQNGKERETRRTATALAPVRQVRWWKLPLLLAPLSSLAFHQTGLSQSLTVFLLSHKKHYLFLTQVLVSLFLYSYSRKHFRKPRALKVSSDFSKIEVKKHLNVVFCSCNHAYVCVWICNVDKSSVNLFKVRNLSYKPPGTQKSILNEINLSLREKRYGFSLN